MSVSPIREATAEDAAACAAIYTPYVTDTAITFEYEPPSAEEMGRRIAAAQREHAWLVHEADGNIAGYAYATRYKERAAYQWAAEVSVYVEMGRRRTGAGRALYEALFERLAERGYRIAVAGLTLPNEASEGLHRAVGFEPVGVYRRIGWKLGRWHDVARVTKRLVDDDGAPREPR